MKRAITFLIRLVVEQAEAIARSLILAGVATLVFAGFIYGDLWLDPPMDILKQADQMVSVVLLLILGGVLVGIGILVRLADLFAEVKRDRRKFSQSQS